MQQGKAKREKYYFLSEKVIIKKNRGMHDFSRIFIFSFYWWKICPEGVASLLFEKNL